MLECFPKRRVPLPPEYASIYLAHYKSNRQGQTAATSLAQSMEAWLHRQVAQDVRGQKVVKKTLEIGAGMLNQLPYEPYSAPYDIVEPYHELYQDSPLLSRIRTCYDDIREVPEEESYDRIISVAAFEHICDLPRVIARAGCLLARHGELRISIPSEGTPLWKLGWMLTTGVEFRLRHGLDYGRLMQYEHVNTAAEIAWLLGYFFRHVRCKVFGISRYLSLYQFYACREPDLQRCNAYSK